MPSGARHTSPRRHSSDDVAATSRLKFPSFDNFKYFAMPRAFHSSKPFQAKLSLADSLMRQARSAIVSPCKQSSLHHRFIATTMYTSPPCRARVTHGRRPPRTPDDYRLPRQAGKPKYALSSPLSYAQDADRLTSNLRPLYAVVEGALLHRRRRAYHQKDAEEIRHQLRSAMTRHTRNYHADTASRTRDYFPDSLYFGHG